ncbi:hypothetical protein [Halococcus sp. IIIV-5B]|uniref:hypothetical protein n=1 Tax=Halococcus sp. IIIV-5B TaxID=2321230 RepID=UPI000E76CDDA|nr:hypothetical protein [Halococcus sp. IIIV-5B]RJT07556.1 hypothetical protein D3261_02880 [Halococcus sp. IIIV-5B]
MTDSTQHQDTTATEQADSGEQRRDADCDTSVSVPDKNEDEPWFMEKEVRDIVREEVSKLIEVRGVEPEEATLDDVWIAGQPLGKIIEGLTKKVKDNTSTSESTGNEPETVRTPLEQIADEDSSNPIGIQITSSVDRAAAIMRNWTQWSKKGPKGRNIRDGLKPLIETELDEDGLAWNQVYRACKKVEHLTNGKIVFTKHSRHGWMLLQPSSAEGA